MHTIIHAEDPTILYQPRTSTMTRIGIYRERVEILDSFERTLRIPREKAKQSGEEYARQSELMRGHSPPILSTDDDNQRLDRKYRRFKTHVSLAESCLTSHDRGVMDPCIINNELLSNRETEWREGRIIAMRVVQPAGKYSEPLTKFWMRLAESGRIQLAGRPEADRIAFAWMMHDLFICIQPFESANERTARLLIQLVRHSLDLPPIMIRAEDSVFHDSRLDFFRWDLFLPLARQYGFL